MKRIVGLSIGPAELVAVRPAGGVLRAQIEAALLDMSAWTAALQAAAEQVLLECGLENPEVQVSLLPPLVQAKIIPFPPLSLSDSCRVISRDADRYFIGRGARVVSVARLPRSAPDAPGLLVCAVSADVYQNIRAALSSAGCRVASVVPAQTTWAAAVRAADVRVRFAGVAVTIPLPQETQVIGVDRNRWWPVRRLIPQEPAPASEAMDDAAVVAAEYAGSSRALEFLEDAEREAIRITARRWALRMAGAALVLLSVSAGLELWGLNRELGAIRDRRAARRSQVTPALAARTELGRLRETLDAVRELDRTRSDWTFVVAQVTTHLPEESYLTGFAASSDSITMRGIAEDASAVIRGLRDAPALVALRVEGPIRQEQAAGEAPIERFLLSARLRPRVGAEPQP